MFSRTFEANNCLRPVHVCLVEKALYNSNLNLIFDFKVDQTKITWIQKTDSVLRKLARHSYQLKLFLSFLKKTCGEFNDYNS